MARVAPEPIAVAEAAAAAWLDANIVISCEDTGAGLSVAPETLYKPFGRVGSPAAGRGSASGGPSQAGGPLICAAPRRDTHGAAVARAGALHTLPSGLSLGRWFGKPRERAASNAAAGQATPANLARDVTVAQAVADGLDPRAPPAISRADGTLEAQLRMPLEFVPPSGLAALPASTAPSLGPAASLDALNGGRPALHGPASAAALAASDPSCAAESTVRSSASNQSVPAAPSLRDDQTPLRITVRPVAPGKGFPGPHVFSAVLGGTSSVQASPTNLRGRLSTPVPATPVSTHAYAARVRGSGLGIPVAKLIAEQLGGSLRLYRDGARSRTVYEAVLPLVPQALREPLRRACAERAPPQAAAKRLGGSASSAGLDALRRAGTPERGASANVGKASPAHAASGDAAAASGSVVGVGPAAEAALVDLSAAISGFSPAVFPLLWTAEGCPYVMLSGPRTQRTEESEATASPVANAAAPVPRLSDPAVAGAVGEGALHATLPNPVIRTASSTPASTCAGLPASSTPLLGGTAAPLAPIHGSASLMGLAAVSGSAGARLAASPRLPPIRAQSSTAKQVPLLPLVGEDLQPVDSTVAGTLPHEASSGSAAAVSGPRGDVGATIAASASPARLLSVACEPVFDGAGELVPGVAVFPSIRSSPGTIAALPRLELPEPGMVPALELPGAVQGLPQLMQVLSATPRSAADAWTRTSASESVAVSPSHAHAGGTQGVSGPTSSKATVPQFGLHLLVADDEAVNRRIMQRLLAKLGCTCVCVSEGDEAIAALVACGQAWSADGASDGAASASGPARASAPFDAFLSDIIMARTDGVETCAQLRAMGCTIPIYAVTGNASLAERLQAGRRTASTNSPLTTQASAAGAASGGGRTRGASGNTSSDPCAPRSSRVSAQSAGATDASSGEALISGFHGAICKPFDQRALQSVLADVASGATIAML